MKKTLYPILLAIAALAPIAIYVDTFYDGLSKEHNRWGEFGSYLSGLYGSLALGVLVYTTYLTQRQFKRQNEDSVFYKLIDSLQNRIQHSIVSVDGKDFSAHKSLKHIADRIYAELSLESVEIGRMLFCKAPESVENVHYSKLLEALNPRKWIETFHEDREAFIADINSRGNFNDRWEQLKNYIGSSGEETVRVREALQATGSVNFYKIPFKERQRHYYSALRRVLDDHGEFLDGYFSTLLYISEVVAVSTNRTQYAQYVRSQLTRYEVIILFYMIAGQEGGRPFRGRILHELGLLERLRTIDCQSLMIDLPSTEQIDKELQSMFSNEA